MGPYNGYKIKFFIAVAGAVLIYSLAAARLKVNNMQMTGVDTGVVD